MKAVLEVIRRYQSAAMWRKIMQLQVDLKDLNAPEWEAAVGWVMAGWAKKMDEVRAYLRQHAPELLPLLPLTDWNEDLAGSNPQELAENLVKLEVALLTRAEAVPAEDEGKILGQVLAVVDENAGRILAVANRAKLSVEKKLQEISRLDVRYYGKNAEELAQILHVSGQAVRATHWWRVERKKYCGEEIESASARLRVCT